MKLLSYIRYKLAWWKWYAFGLLPPHKLAQLDPGIQDKLYVEWVEREPKYEKA